MVTVVHVGGSIKQVDYLGVVELDGQKAALIHWPLGDIFQVDLLSGKLKPDADQSPCVAAWSADAATLARMQRDANPQPRRQRRRQLKAA